MLVCNMCLIVTLKYYCELIDNMNIASRIHLCIFKYCIQKCFGMSFALPRCKNFMHEISDLIVWMHLFYLFHYHHHPCWTTVGLSFIAYVPEVVILVTIYELPILFLSIILTPFWYSNSRSLLFSSFFLCCWTTSAIETSSLTSYDWFNSVCVCLLCLNHFILNPTTW